MSDELLAALELMDRIGGRVVPVANPCPSRAEWEELRGHVTAVVERLSLRERIQTRITGRLPDRIVQRRLKETDRRMLAVYRCYGPTAPVD